MIEEHMLNEARVHEAAEFAARVHRGQMYGAQPYARHLSDVTVILRFRMDRPVNTTLLSAGWLHDVLEDTDTTRAELENRFGADVANIVWACTGEGQTRRERNRGIYARLQTYPAAACVKLADRLANVESCWRASDTRLFMYYKEHTEFRQALLAADVKIASFTALAALDSMLGWRA